MSDKKLFLKVHTPGGGHYTVGSWAFPTDETMISIDRSNNSIGDDIRFAFLKGAERVEVIAAEDLHDIDPGPVTPIGGDS